MSRCLMIKTENGVEALLRIVGVLKRKRFEILHVNLEHGDGCASHLQITIGDNSEYGSECAAMHVRKLFGITEMIETKGEH